MSLLAEFEAEARGMVRRCLLGKVIDSLPPEDQRDTRLALDTDDIPSSAICRILNKHGHKLGQNVVRMHRNGTCCCGGEQDEPR